MYRSSIPSEEVNLMPLKAFEGEISVIDTLEKVPHAIASLTACSIVGFDTETKPCFTRGEYHHVALLQLSTEKEAFLFRLDKIGLPDELIPILESPFKLKIGAAVADDIRGLQKHTKFKPGGFVDLQNMMAHYSIQDRALKKMAALVLGIQISKSQQTSNWEAVNYSPEQISYAATDASVCRDIFFELILNGEQVTVTKTRPAVAQAPVDASETVKKSSSNRNNRYKKYKNSISPASESSQSNSEHA